MKSLGLIMLLLCTSLHAMADESEKVTFPMSLSNATSVGVTLGKIIATETQYGVELTPDLSGLPTGLHDVRLNDATSCTSKELNVKQAPTGGASDIPPLYADANGKTNKPVLAVHLKLKDIKGRTLTLHQRGKGIADNDIPLACGVGQ